MAIPSITTTNPGYEQIAAGAAYSRSFSATNSPTSWAVTNLPAGLSFNTSTGEITGSPTASTPTASAISVTATNGDGTSAAQSWLIVVLPAVTGTTQGEWVIPVDLDIFTRRLSLPGIGVPQPADEPPAPSEGAAVLGSWVEGERFVLSLGLTAAGVLQQLDPTRIRVLWRENATEPSIELQVDETDVTLSGSGTTARYEIPVFIDSDLVFSSLTERVSGIDVTGLLQIIAEGASDDRDFSATSAQESLGTFTESSAVADTIAITIDTESEAAREYDVTIDAVFPSAPSLDCQIVRRISLTYNTGGSTYVLASATGSTTDTGSSTVEANWDSTLTNTSLTATSTGISVGTTVAGSAQKAPGYEIVIPLEQFTINATPVLVSAGSGIESWYLRNEAGSNLYEWTLVDGDSPAAVALDLIAGLPEAGITAEFDDTTDTVTLRFAEGTSVHSVQNVQSLTEINRGPNSDSSPSAPSYSDAYVQVSVTGVEMPGNSLKFANNPARFKLVGSFDV